MKNIIKIVGGGLLLVTATGVQADQVILDDLIVDGSSCVGQDCVNGESFGFDTIRIKENNLRIKAQDTSNSASFPTNDWQITFNDSSNGGANKFSIDDIDGGRTPLTIEAGAPSHSLYVDDGGRLGLGTSTPVVDVHVKSGNTPTLRLEQDGSSGFTAQTWDVAGNEANFFIRDASNGSTLPFRVFPGAPSNALTIEAGGQIGMGTTSPSQDLEIQDNGVVGLDLNNTTSTRWRLRVGGVGNLAINAPDDATVTGDEFVLAKDGTLTLTGGLITGTPAGTCNPGPCDATFRPSEFLAPSIEEHASFMWENSYLWAVGPTREGLPMNLTKKTGAILHELEVAHIYIEQLHLRLEALEAKLEAN